MLDALAEISIAATGETDLDLLVALSLVSLVEPENELSTDVSTPMRVRLHPLLRELAQEEWRQQPEATQNAAITGLLAGVTDLVTAHERDFVLLQQEEALIADAIRQAAQRIISPREVSDVILTLNDYVTAAGHWQIGMELFQMELYVCRKVKDRVGEGVMLNNLGLLSNQLGRKEEAEQYYQQSLVISRETGNRRGEGTTLNNLGEIARGLGRKRAAERFCKRALMICRETGNREGEGTALNNLGVIARSLGRKGAAGQYFFDALDICREVGNRAKEGMTLNNLGELFVSLEMMEEAERCLVQALTIQLDLHVPEAVGVTLNSLGLLAYRLGKREDAVQFFEQALAILEMIGAAEHIHIVRDNLDRLRQKEAQTETILLASSIDMPSPKKRRWWRR